MNKIYKGLAVAAVAASLSACASAPEDIKAVSYDPQQISYLTCTQLGQYENTLKASYQEYADKENTARVWDAAGIILIGMPVGSIHYKYEPDRIADIKGRIEAVHELESQGNCQLRVASN
jgi:hypothetical protein